MDQATQGRLRTKGGKAPLPSASHEANGKAPAHRGAIQTLSNDHAEARSRQILAAMMSFSDGDFTARLPLDWSGTDGRISEAFNQTIGNAKRITLEAARLSNTAGKEGRLSQRMSAPGAPGSWAAQVDSRNTLMDDQHLAKPVEPETLAYLVTKRSATGASTP